MNECKQCVSCIHNGVCSYKGDMDAVLRSIQEVTVHFSDKHFARLCDVKFIKPIKVECEHYLQKLVNIR
jgi:hypothetical protein